jgi:hypothetical protein
VYGPRWLQLNEGLGIGAITILRPDLPGTGGNLRIINDQFPTRNMFLGGQLGVQGEARRGSFYFGGRALLGLGWVEQVSNIDGGTRIVARGSGITPGLGGVFALPTNIGRHERDQFGIVPELGVHAGVQLTDMVRLYAGYTILYWPEVVRPGEQIDRGLNPTQFPVNVAAGSRLVGPARPAFAFNETDFWAQGVNFGVEIRY